MWLSEVGTPVTSADRKNAELGDDDGGADSSCDFLGGLDTETNVTLGVANDNNGLEASALTGTGLFLDGFDLDRNIHISTNRYLFLMSKMPQFHVFLTPMVPKQSPETRRL